MLGKTYRDEQTCAKRFEPRITPNIRCCLTERRCRCRRTYKPFGCAFGARSALGAARLAGRDMRVDRGQTERDQELRQYVQQAAANSPASTADQLAKLAGLRDRGHLRRGVRAGGGQGPGGLNSWPPWAVCAAGLDGPGKQEPAALHTRIRSSCAAPCLTAGGWAQAPPARASGVPRHRGYRAVSPRPLVHRGPMAWDRAGASCGTR